jgi:predicted dehydrogenase
VLAAGRGVDLAAGTRVAVARARHASVVTVPASWVTPVPVGVRDRDAALAYLAIIAGYGVRRAQLTPGDSLCVIGAGPIGALALRLAALENPGAITVVARTNRAEAAARAAGAQSFLTAGEDLEEVGAAVVIEATGAPEAIGSAIAAARSGGAVVLLGSPRGITEQPRLGEFQRKRLRLVGAHISALATEMRRSGEDPFGTLAKRFLAAVADDHIDVTDLAGVALDPREIEYGYRRLAAGELRHTHLDWSLVPDRVRRRPLLSGPALAAPRPRLDAPALAAPARPRRPLRFALIGCGDIGWANARAVAAAANTELTCCHDATPALAEAVAARFGGTVAPTLAAAFDPARVDAVFLCVPHDQHAPLAVRGAEAGLHIVVEKPLAEDVAAARGIVGAAAAANVALSVCFPYRYLPAVRAARALVEAGALGPLRGAAVLFHADKPAAYWIGGFSGRAASDWRGSRRRAGGGVLIMNLTHYVDLVAHVAGELPARILATSYTPAGAEVEAGIAVSAALAGGGIASFTGSAATRGAPPTRFELWGEHGTIRLEPEASAYSERAAGGLVPGTWTPLPAVSERDERVIFVERFADAVLHGRPPEVSGTAGLSVQAVVEAAYDAVRAVPE